MTFGGADDVKEQASWQMFSVRAAAAAAAVAAVGVTVAVPGCRRESSSPDAVSPKASVVTVLPGAAAGPASDDSEPFFTTPGDVRCENVTCRLAIETCCADEDKHVGRCVLRGDAAVAVCAPNEIQRDCDERSDCNEGKVCCLDWGCTGEGCPSFYACVDAPCMSGEEICLPGGSCREGFRCSATESGLGRCDFVPRPVVCGEEKCSGSTPVCCWDSAKRTARCAKECPNQNDNEFAVRCTTARDCGGHPCANYGPVRGGNTFACTSIAATALWAPTMLCTERSDCVPLYSVGGVEPTGCNPAPELPPGVKQCEYGTEDEAP